MISRIRIEAYGRAASDVEHQLLAFGEKCDVALNVVSCASGEMVIERQLAEPYGSEFGFKGRYTLYPDIGTAPSIPGHVLAENAVYSETATG